MKTTWTLLGLIVLSPAWAWAEEPVFDLPPLTTTAWHFPVEVRAIPGSVEVIGGAALEPARAVSLVDVLERSANVQFRSYSGSPLQAEVNLRGFGAVSTQRVLVLVDGLPLNPPDMGNINWLEIPPALVQQVEVIRGAQTTLYGNHAVGGVIKITTKEAPAEGLFSATAQAGNLGFHQEQVSLGQSVNGLSIFAAAQHHEEDGYRAYSAQSADTLHLHLGYAPESAAWSAKARFTYVDSESQAPGTLDDASYAADARISAGGRVEDSQRSLAAQFSLERSAGDWQFSLLGGYTDKDLHARPDGRESDNHYRLGVANPRVLRRWAHGETQAGVDLQGNWLDVDHYERGAVITEDQVSLRTAALYVHHRQELGPVWQLSGGLRGETAQYAFDELRRDPFAPEIIQGTSAYERTMRGFSGNLGIVRQASEAFRQWLRVDRLYRYPALDEIFSYQGFQPFANELDPETGTNLELGGEWRHEQLTLRLNAFTQWLDGEIDYFGFANRNLPDSRRQGLETTVAWQATHWRVQFDHSWTEAEFTADALKGRDRYLVPKHQVTTTLELRPTERFDLGTSFTYTSSAYEGDDFLNAEAKLPGYGIVDVWARARVWQGLNLFAAADNVFDRKYATVKYLGSWYPAPGIAWRAGAQYTF